MSYIDDLKIKYKLAILPEDALVTNPTIGNKYHLSWASSRGMVWKLKEIEGIWAFMETPKTGKPLTAKLCDLRERNYMIAYNAKRRIFGKAMIKIVFPPK